MGTYLNRGVNLFQRKYWKIQKGAKEKNFSRSSSPFRCCVVHGQWTSARSVRAMARRTHARKRLSRQRFWILPLSLVELSIQILAESCAGAEAAQL